MNTHHIAHTSSKPVGGHPDRSAKAPRRAVAKPSEEPSHQDAGGFSSILRRYPITLGITALIGLVAVTVSALILYNSSDPTKGILPASMISMGLASVGGGLVMGRMIPTVPVAAGLLSGGLTGGLLLICSLIGGDGGILRWCMCGGTVLLHLLGGMIARPREKAPAHTTGKHRGHR